MRKNSFQRHHAHTYTECTPLSVGLGDTLELILLLDGVRVAASLGSVDQLLSKALGNALDVAERGLTGTDGEEGDTLVDTAERGHIDGLATDGTGGTDTGGVLTGTSVDDGVNENLSKCRFVSLRFFIPRLRIKRTWMGFWSVMMWICQ